MNRTVKQFLDTLEEMRTIYPFEDDKTVMKTNDFMSNTHTLLEIATVDEKTGIQIVMSKRVNREV